MRLYKTKANTLTTSITIGSCHATLCMASTIPILTSAVITIDITDIQPSVRLTARVYDKEHKFSTVILTISTSINISTSASTSFSIVVSVSISPLLATTTITITIAINLILTIVITIIIITIISILVIIFVTIIVIIPITMIVTNTDKRCSPVGARA